MLAKHCHQVTKTNISVNVGPHRRSKQHDQSAQVT